VLTALVSAFVSLFTPRVSGDYIKLPEVTRLVIAEKVRRGFED
jgi:hypothetical protein